MSERPWQPNDAELEQALRELGARIAYPPTPPLAESVRRRLDMAASTGAARRSRRPRLWSAPLRGLRRSLALIVLALLAAGVLAVSPAARATVARWFSPFHGIVIIFNPPLATPTPAPAPVGRSLRLGRRVTLSAAQAHVHYHIVVPTSAELRVPDEVYLDGQAPGGMVSLLYHARPGLPRAPGTGVGLLLTEFRGDLGPEPMIFAKGMEPGTHLTRVSVQGVTGYWITGKPHVFWYAAPGGMVQEEHVRLAGNVLLWERHGLVLRLEAAIPRAEALHIAASVR